MTDPLLEPPPTLDAQIESIIITRKTLDKSLVDKFQEKLEQVTARFQHTHQTQTADLRSEMFAEFEAVRAEMEAMQVRHEEEHTKLAGMVRDLIALVLERCDDDQEREAEA